MSFEPMSIVQPGDAVGDLRGRLVFLGYLAPPAHGTFDHTLEAAVRHYQDGVGHPQTGTVDEALWQQLCADTDPLGYSTERARAGEYDTLNAPTVLHDVAEYRTIDVRTVLNNLATRITALAGHHAMGIGSACAYFETYALDRLKQLDGRYSGSDYAKNLTRHVTGAAGIGITKILTAGLAAMAVGGPGGFILTSLWIGFSMAAERRIGNAAKDALVPNDNLAGAIPHFVLSVSNEVMTEFGQLESAMNQAIDELVTELNHHVALGDDTVHWLDPLLSAGPVDLDHFIAHDVGIPTTWDEVRDHTYHLLVEAFEDMVLSATEYAPSPFDAAAASLLQGAHGDRYSSAAQVAHDSEQEKHHRAQVAADQAAAHLPHAERPHR